ncbi:MAG: NADH-quinone oxidoreductase subunit L [Zetaproteobacteria bacterium]|nr:MAG: NADH-quinone oxidoreductase subunit L [Zetaproteobacteria bacterium]
MELLAVFSPLVAFLIAGLFGKVIGDKGCQIVTCAAVIIAALSSIRLFFDVILTENMVDGAYTTILTEWITSGAFTVQWSLRIDQLAVVMMCVVNIVSACVHVYSVGYMSNDPCKGRFMAYLSLFTFAMLMLVTSDNLLQLFFGWEGVGVASYLLIGFWNHKHSANAAAQKAFIVNRIGDFGLALGIMAVFVVFGSIEFSTIFENAEQYADTTMNFLGFQFHALTVICLLLFIGAMGKSAQLGLHTWLPDAMEGPTPVSALIHAATMVTAGVFLVARFSPVFEYAPIASMVVAVVGATTAFVAATIGLTQYDIKRVIAYSTMSQLGYMFFALGVSAYGAAIFHLVTHAFFKALLFLGAGSVIHAMSDEQDMRNMGGLWKKIPVTYAMMWIGSLALAGIWPFAGYFSKDIILESAWADHTWFGNYAYWMGIAAAFMTAFYSWRLIIMTFHGTPRASKEVMSHVHESPSMMLMPLLVLATGAILAGAVFYGGFVGSSSTQHASANTHANITPAAGEEHKDEHLASDKSDGDEHVGADDDKKERLHGNALDVNAWSKEYFWHNSIKVLPENDTVEAAHSAPFWVKKMPILVGAFGIFLAYMLYMVRPGGASFFVKMFKPFHTLFFNKWFFDPIYHRLFVTKALSLGRIFWRSDKNIIDRVGSDGIAGLSSRLASGLSKFQSGYVYQYALVMIIAFITIITWFVLKADPSFYSIQSINMEGLTR